MTLNEFIQSPHSKEEHYLLLGKPVSHSVSPLMHNTAIEHYELKGKYYPIELQTNEIALLASHLNKMEFKGANITIPYKIELMDLVDELTLVGKEIGAINTIYKDEGMVIGHNTDAHGFLQPLLEIEDDLEKERAIIFGSGGATKAIVQALNDFGYNEVYIVSRSKNKHDQHANVTVCSYDDWIEYADDADLIINATPLGMWPDTDASPVRDDQLEYLQETCCYDIVYNPRVTKFIKQARSVNATTIGGLEMLIHQADASFQRWTNKHFPIGLIKLKLESYFEQ